MNLLVALLADDQGLSSACRHSLDPEGFLPLSWSVQIRELTGVVDLAALL